MELNEIVKKPIMSSCLFGWQFRERFGLFFRIRGTKSCGWRKNINSLTNFFSIGIGSSLTCPRIFEIPALPYKMKETLSKKGKKFVCQLVPICLSYRSWKKAKPDFWVFFKLWSGKKSELYLISWQWHVFRIIFIVVLDAENRCSDRLLK